MLDLNALARFVSHNGRSAWMAVTLASLTIGLLLGLVSYQSQLEQRLSLLQTETQRSSIEITSVTLNANLMGSLTLLGLIDQDIKQEVSNGLLSVDAHIGPTLQTVGNAFDADGVFVVGADGIVKTSWDRVGKPSTGLDVQFRPYYKMAMQGQSSVYAAVSMARGDRALYFTAPVFAEQARATSGAGALVARTNLDRIDKLLKDRPGVESLLLSPQGIVFSSSRAAWVGAIDGQPTAERLSEIRALKQFGPLFESREPAVLPLTANAGLQWVENKRYAIASAAVKWNDPSGDWKLVLMEDIANSVGPASHVARGVFSAVLALLIGWLALHLLRGRHAQLQSNQQLQAYADEQAENLAFRAKVADISLALQRCQTAPDLATVFLTEARHLLGVLQGVLYVADLHTEALQLAGSMACAENVSLQLMRGEGLLGQAALDQKTRVIPTPPEGFWTVRSGLGKSEVAALLLNPLILHDQVIGVLEVAVLTPLDATALERFEELSLLLANNLDILRRRARHTEEIA
jgi:two-component system, NtrC family, C4-dicarboxylate transport sensor histidine kinase DctB